MPKVLLITNIPTPYRIPLFNELSRQLTERNIDFKVIFGGLSYPRRKWKIDMSDCKFSYEVLNKSFINLYFLKYGIFLYSGITRLLLKENPDLIITNGFSLSTMKVCFLKIFKKIKYVIWSGAIVRHIQKDAFSKVLLRKLLVRYATSFISYGTKSKLYLEDLGANPNSVFIGINTVDTIFYNSNITSSNSVNIVDTKKHILCLGHITLGKKLDNIIHSIKYLSYIRQDFVVDVVGEGPELENIINMSNAVGVRQYFNFTGFKQKHEIPHYLSMAKCFLFPSEYDIWGLVLVEAMSVGIPCISSIHAGATCDLIQDGVTGFAMDFSNHGEIAKKIDWILCNPDLSRNIGDNAKYYIQKHVNLETSVNGFMTAINKNISWCV